MNPWTWIIPLAVAAGLCASAAVLGIRAMNQLIGLVSNPKRRRKRTIRAKPKPRSKPKAKEEIA